MTFLLLLACRTDQQVLPVDSGVVVDSGDSADSDDDSGDTGDTGPVDTGDFVPTTSWCLDWEDGTLEGAGYDGQEVQLADGALLWNVREGTDFSGLVGEELIDVRESRALVMRSSHAGDVDSVAIATTEPFVIEDDHLWWYQLSEVGAEGIDFYADLLVGGAVLASLDDLAVTGGYVPALSSEHVPIAGFPDIGYGEPTEGELVWQVTDVQPWLGQEVRLRLYQHTKVEAQGFFTIVDDICLGAAFSSDIEWAEPNPDH
ncbi:MAG TPA: hypothetical protein QGF58_15065 [Myxococcota bacterium]|nr:hypothetical protein [Myxococcota bacterium]